MITNIINGLPKKIYIILSAILALIILLLLFLAMIIERKNLGIESELNGKRLIFLVSEEKIISREPKIYNANKLNSVIDKEIQTNIYEEEKPSIAIIIGGVGLSRSISEKIMALPGAVTLGFSSYSQNIDDLSFKALAAGHELLMHIPLEPIRYPLDDPGPNALLSNLDIEENERRLDYILSLITDIKGIYTTDEENFTKSLFDSTNLIKTLMKRNKLFVYGFGSTNSALKQMAARYNYSIINADLEIDNDMSRDSITEKLFQLEELALNNGIALGYAQAYPITIELIENWTKTLAKKGLQLIPITTYNNLHQTKKYSIINHEER